LDFGLKANKNKVAMFDRSNDPAWVFGDRVVDGTVIH
jgi:hypothetical protein